MRMQAFRKLVLFSSLVVAASLVFCGSLEAQEQAPADLAAPPAPAVEETAHSEPPAQAEAEHAVAHEGAASEHAGEAAHEGNHGFPTGQVVAAVINFALFIVILVWVSKGAVKQFYKKRSEELTQAIRDAQKTLEAARAMEQEAQARLAQASLEAEKILENAKDAAGRHSGEIIEAARKQAERILADGQATIQAETKKVTDELLTELSTRVVEIAKKKLQEKVDPSAQRGLVGDYLNKVGEV